MDWDKLRIFHAAAAAGSFTHAGEALHLSQSAISRQVAALEYDLKTSLFHRHARGLLLTEQGEMLFRTVQEVLVRLEGARLRLSDAREKPHGLLKVTANTGFGSAWLAPRLAEFRELYPDIELVVILTDDELDLSMREADVALRLREPTQPDLIRRRLFHGPLFGLCLTRLSGSLRAAAIGGRSRRPPHRLLRRQRRGLSEDAQPAADFGPRREKSARARRFRSIISSPWSM